MTGNIDRIPIQVAPMLLDNVVVTSVSEAPASMRGNKLSDVPCTSFEIMCGGKRREEQASKANVRGRAADSEIAVLETIVAEINQTSREAIYVICHLNFLLIQQ